MNEALLKNVYKAIRGDRAALRTLVERYRGVSYALAYRETHSFPRAQIVAMRSWVKLTERLPNLGEPERFLELLAEAVRAAAPGAHAGADPEPDEQEHSILRTAKVQTRHALRKALAECARPEANAFFLRFVEGLTTEEIGELYGVEPTVAIEAQAAVSLDLVYRAGLAGASENPPTLEQLPAERREALLLAVRQAESSLDDEGNARLSELVQGNADVRREVEGARTVLSLAPATFAAHRLHTEFVRETMQGMPLIEARVPVPAPPPPPRKPVEETSPDASATIGLAVGGFIVGALLPIPLIQGMQPLFAGWQPTALLMGVVSFALPLGLLALAFARPPLPPPVKWPQGYHLFYGILLGVLVMFLGFEIFGSDTQRVAMWSSLLPVWAVLCLGLVGVRMELALRMLEERFEARFRRLETAVQVGADARTPTPAPAPPAAPPSA